MYARQPKDAFLRGISKSVALASRKAEAVRLYKTANALERIVPSLAKHAVATRLVKRVDQYGREVDWKVEGDDRVAYFKSRADAAACMAQAFNADIIAALTTLRKKAKELLVDEEIDPATAREIEEPDPDLEQELESQLAVATSGAPAPHDELNGLTSGGTPSNPGFAPEENARRRGPMIDGVRQPSTKKRTRIL